MSGREQTPADLPTEPTLPTCDSGSYSPGQLIAGKYALKSILGEGGMGTVWLATNTILEVDIALKLLHADYARDEEASRRFLHEARATAKLRAPTIVQIHDFGTTRLGHAFMVMEHLEGESLGDMLDRRLKLDDIEAVQILIQVLDALHRAHQERIVHRDLKPENILIVRDGDAYTCKVVDFGIAKGLREPLHTNPGTEDERIAAVRRSASRLTEHGALLGSPQYMSPEQARGEMNVDHRADLWGFSVCLYECVAGFRPFEDDAIDQLLLKVLFAEPTKPEGIDEHLWQIIKSGLDRNRDQRWQSANDIGSALALWLLKQGVEVDASGQSVRSHWLGEAFIAAGPSRSQRGVQQLLVEHAAGEQARALREQEQHDQPQDHLNQYDEYTPPGAGLRPFYVAGALGMVAIALGLAGVLLSMTGSNKPTGASNQPTPAETALDTATQIFDAAANSAEPASSADDSDVEPVAAPPPMADTRRGAAPRWRPPRQPAAPSPAAKPEPPTKPTAAPALPSGALPLPDDADF